MGCDIHMHTERKIANDFKPSSYWANADNWRVNPWFDPFEEGNGQPMEVVELGGDRNYALFTILASVRTQGNEALPIFSQPRGLPDDVSGHTQTEWDYWEGDAHSASYATLYELETWYNSLDATDRELCSQADLHDLLEKLTERAKEVMWSWKPLTDKKKQDFRIVFWFDN